MDIMAGDPLQALRLALGCGASIPRERAAAGGDLRYPAGDELPIEAYFGPFVPSART